MGLTIHRNSPTARTDTHTGTRDSSGGSSIQNETIKAALEPIIDEESLEKLHWINDKDPEVLNYDPKVHSGIVNLQRINDIQRINKFFEGLNDHLPIGSYNVICLETKNQRKRRLLNRYPRIVSYPWYLGDFLVKRVLPKCQSTKRAYFWLTKGRNRVISLTEAMGRLVSCGFEIIDYRRVDGLTYIISRKRGAPVYDMSPTYGPLVKLTRIGYKQNRIAVYKIRTMHPYAEYIQEFLYERHSTDNGDKIINDFRITSWGKWFRKLWIDELPMLYNYLKQELKIVGVRPLSAHKFSTYPEDLQKKRTETKPGLVPPFYADLPETVEEFHASEEKYLNAYQKKPIRTDIRYFFKALYNIFIKGARSK